MPASEISAHAYLGSLLATQLLSSQTTILLNGIGPAESGTLTDNDGLLQTSDDGTATFNGDPITYIGSGTAQPGVDVLGLVVPLGTAVPLVAFEAGGTVYFVFPEDEPNLLGAVALVINLTTDPYQVFTPICFCAGTMIATPDGDRPIETLTAGDRVLDVDGTAHPILWIGARHMTLPIGLSASFAKWFPVRIPANAFGPGVPFRDLQVSQQHRLSMQTPRTELYFGSSPVLVPAKALVGDALRLETGIREVIYYHILCARHVMIMANGMPAESLFLGDLASHANTDPHIKEALEAFPELYRIKRKMVTAHPVLRAKEARVLARDLQTAG